MSGVQFFEMSFADINRPGIALDIDNQSENVEALVNRDPFWTWESQGSDDSDTITFTVDFDHEREIDTFFALGNNLEDFSLEYRNSVGDWIELLSETANTDENYFAQFTAVSTEAVRLLMTRTFVVDAEKTIQDFIITKEIGQLEGYPGLKFIHKGADTKKKMLTGKTKFVFSSFERELQLNFKDHVGENDRGLFLTLAEKREPFLVWPCGGDPDQFAHGDLGYRFQDLFLVGLADGFQHEFTKNLYFSGMTATIKLIEAA